MNRKGLIWIVSAIVVAIVIAIGCGGGGGGSATSSTSTSTTAGSTSGTSGVVMLVAENGSGEIIDPTNLNPGQSVQFKVVSVSPTDYSVTPLSVSRFSTTDLTGSAGNLNLTTGLFTAGPSTNGTNFTISAVYSGSTYSEFYGVKPVQGIVTGTILDSNSVPVPFARVLFEDSTGTQVGAVVAGVDGAFTASVPTSAVRFDIDPATLPITPDYSAVPSTAYFRYFTYGSGTYNPLTIACSAPLPPLSSGVPVALPSQVVVMAAATLSGTPNTPPPPPNCTP